MITGAGEDAGWLRPGLARSVPGDPTLRRPTHILGGGADPVVNTGLHGQRTASLIPGARFERLPGAGHMLRPFQTAAVVRAALAVHSAA